jgi:hypothetical protein
MRIKKKWATVIASIMALLILATSSTAVLAQSEDEATDSSRPRFRDGLALVAPIRAPVGVEISMSVFARWDQRPVKDADIWAFTEDNAETIHEKVEALREADTQAGEADWEVLAREYGFFIGTTNGNGRLMYTFADEGRYLLIALKPGYIPGRTGILVKDLPKALGIDAPRRASAGEEVTVTVFQRGTEDPVKDAAVWAFTRGEAEALQEKVQALREQSENATAEVEVDWEAMASAYGFLLGTTNGSGKLKYAFEEEGWYLLIALKAGYRPGRTGIAIRDIPDALAIQSPRRAPVDERVTMTVTQRGTEDPVKDASVWAFTRNNIETLMEKLKELREAGTPMNEVDWDELANEYGFFIGTSNGSGKVMHAFSEAGRYLLLATKPGYLPGRSGIAIVEVEAEVSSASEISNLTLTY